MNFLMEAGRLIYSRPGVRSIVIAISTARSISPGKEPPYYRWPRSA